MSYTRLIIKYQQLALTTGLLSSCGYGSMLEAEKACEECAAKGGITKGETSKDGVIQFGKDNAITYKPIQMRSCRVEAETNQVLGMEYKQGIVKRFRF